MGAADQSMRAELAARIAFQEATISTWSQAAGTRPSAIEATARSHTGFAWFDIAVCRVLLGDGPGAAEAFVRAAEWMSSALELVSPPTLATYGAALEAAVLSGDGPLAARLAARPAAPEPRPSLVGDRLAWALALPALFKGDDDRVRAEADAASAIDPKKAWYPGLGEALGAVVAADEASLVGALETVLAKHIAYARSKKSWCYNSAPCLLCVPAAVLVRLAARRGMAVGEPARRRATIPLTLAHSAPGETLDVEVDFLAGMPAA